MKWGAQEEWFRQRAEIGKPPRAWLERTEVLEPLISVFEAFFDVSPSRYTPMGEGIIPLAEILAYCDLAGVQDAQARLDLMRGVRAMDRVFMAERNEARKAENASGTADR